MAFMVMSMVVVTPLVVSALYRCNVLLVSSLMSNVPPGMLEVPADMSVSWVSVGIDQVPFVVWGSVGSHFVAPASAVKLLSVPNFTTSSALQALRLPKGSVVPAAVIETLAVVGRQLLVVSKSVLEGVDGELSSFFLQLPSATAARRRRESFFIKKMGTSARQR
jgi:hypothetical protein